MSQPQAKDGHHGLLAHRPPSAFYDLGTTPLRAIPAPTRTAQKRDQGTHRMVKPQVGGLTFRGPHPSKTAEGGAGE